MSDKSFSVLPLEEGEQAANASTVVQQAVAAASECLSMPFALFPDEVKTHITGRVTNQMGTFELTYRRVVPAVTPTVDVRSDEV